MWITKNKIKIKRVLTTNQPMLVTYGNESIIVDTGTNKGNNKGNSANIQELEKVL